MFYDNLFNVAYCGPCGNVLRSRYRAEGMGSPAGLDIVTADQLAKKWPGQQRAECVHCSRVLFDRTPAPVIPLGPLSAESVASAIAYVSKTGTLASEDYPLADRMAALVANDRRPAPELFRILSAGGLEGIKPRDSRAALARRLHNRLTARERARLRAEC